MDGSLDIGSAGSAGSTGSTGSASSNGQLGQLAYKQSVAPQTPERHPSW